MPASKWARTTVENSQVRMMSWAWGRMSIGKVDAYRASSVRQPVAIWGVSDEVAQVSITSGSPAKPSGRPLWDSSKPGGQSADGSTGRARGSGRIGLSQSGETSASRRYHRGMGTPKKRWRLMSQSPLSPAIQLS